jgi:phosphatidylinositol glycan class P protein
MSANVSSIEKRTRRLRSSSSSIIVQKTSNKLSFRELQRLQARKLETIGFAGWISSTILYGLYFMWAFLSDETLESYGITYYPSKNWAIAIPAMIVMTYLFSLVFYKAINLLSTPSLD